MNLIFVRHSDAGGDIDNEPIVDAARQLEPEGIELAGRVAEGLKRLGLAPPQIMTSPFARCAQTAAIIAAVLTPGQLPNPYDWLIEDAPLPPIVSNLSKVASNTMVVTHRDVMERFAAYIVDGHPSTRVLSLPFASAVLFDTELVGAIKAGVGHISWAIEGGQLAMLADTRPGVITEIGLKPAVGFGALISTTASFEAAC